MHQLRSRNINAPIPDIDGPRPYGGSNSIFLYESSGLYRQHQIITNVNARIRPKLTLSGFYAYGHAMSDFDGAGTFHFNQYDLAPEYSRAGFDARHRVQMNGAVSLPWKLRIAPLITLSTGQPYNITAGRDLNGDGLFNDRPAFATDLNRPSVVRTTVGAFDLAPLAGLPIVPRNYAQGPGLASVNVRLSKEFAFGEKHLILSLSARNAINHANFGSPNGNLSSALFGRSTSLAGGNGGNRRLDTQLRFEW